MIEVVTSLNLKLWNYYGERAIREFAHFAGPGIRLNVVFEGEIPSNARDTTNIRFHIFKSDGHQLFLRRFSHLYEANGLRVRINNERSESQVNLSWDFRYNAVRFSFKVFSINQVRKDLPEGDFLAWLDADIRVLRPFDAEQLLPFLPEEGQLMSYLGRKNFPSPNPYSEAGWLGFNLKHRKLDEFLEFVESQYTTGEVFTQTEWHDSWLWDVARKLFESKDVGFRNISGAASSLEHPFVNCGLGTYFDHLKGPERKRRGRSFTEDFVSGTKPI